MIKTVPKLRHQRGLTLIELMVALVISLVIVIAAAAFFLNSGRTRDTQEAASLLQDNARFATDIITRNIQQAGYQNYVWSTIGASVRREVSPPSDGQPDLRGFNNTNGAAITTSAVAVNGTGGSANNSDVLVVRFQGSGTGAGDGSMIDCLGRPQPQPDASLGYVRSYSIFEAVQPSGSSEPELRCKRFVPATGSFDTEPVVRGVEMLQFMYGVDTNNDTFVDQWMNAAQVDALGGSAMVNWSKVKSVRVGMILRSPANSAVPGPSTTLSPLGTMFSQNLDDTLVVNDGRLRRLVTFTVNLRNPL